jgi:hypothetical protein
MNAVHSPRIDLHQECDASQPGANNITASATRPTRQHLLPGRQVGSDPDEESFLALFSKKNSASF